MATPETGPSIGIGGVIWLIVLFAGVIFWAFHPRNRKRSQADAENALGDENTRS